MRKSLILLLFLLGMTRVVAQESPFSWITGTWTGPGFGGTFEEVWSEPDAEGTVMGMFRYLQENEVVFYEFWILEETGMKLRHFNPDFSAWEAKEEWVDFEMKEAGVGKIEMKGLTYELTATNQLKISLNMRNEQDEVYTEVFILDRVE